MARLDRTIHERNRELLAQRLNWPPGAVEVCRSIERNFPRWCAWWSPAHGYGASPIAGPTIRRRTHNAPTAEGLRTLIRQDIQRHKAEQERNTRFGTAISAADAPPDC